MTAYKEINFSELPGCSDKESLSQQTVVFKDEYLSRQAVTLEPVPGIETTVIIDRLHRTKVTCCHISMNFLQRTHLDIVFPNSRIISDLQGRLITDADSNRLFWIGRDPVLRSYDSNGRITESTQLAFSVTCESDEVRLTITGGDGDRVEFAVVVFAAEVESFEKQLSQFEPVELRDVNMNVWFNYSGVADVWGYFINGKLFNSQHPSVKRGWEAQNIAYAMYYYLEFLYYQTEKPLYALLSDFVAYSVLLTLPEDGRWRHGIWTDLMETHTAHQVSGIHVLLSYYERTGRDTFLQKAGSAMDYIISCADELGEGGIWFLHDSLELNMDDARLYYKHLKPSNAFGKSAANTICLNTHIGSLTALHKLCELDTEDKYKEPFEKGMNALKMVLQTRPCGVLFAAVYGLRDILIKLRLKANKKLIAKLQKGYDKKLRQSILPFLKEKTPRLVMPNGFTERDLTFSPLSDFYHLINMELLLVLYGLSPQPWLLKIIQKGMAYTVSSGIVKYMADFGSNAATFLGVLLQYCSRVDEEYLRFLPEYMGLFRAMDLPVPVKILAKPVIADYSAGLWVADPDVVILTPVCSSNISAVMVNLTGTDRQVVLTSARSDVIEELEIIDSENNRIDAHSPVVVGGKGYVKIVKKRKNN